MHRRVTLAVCLVVTLALFFVARGAAAAPPELRTQISADTVGVGDVIQLQLQAMVVAGSPQPADPRPGNTTGFSLRGTSIGSSAQTSLQGGVRVDKFGVTATWNLRADRPGTFTIGPPTVSVGGKRFAGQPARIVVVPAGQAPQRRQGGPVDPFDIWKQLAGGRDPFGDEDDPTRTPTDTKLTLDAPRGQIAFLHATIDKPKVTVGEQVTLSVFLYVDRTQNEPEFNDVHEATAGEFLKRSLLDNDAQARFLGDAMVGGRAYHVKLIRKSALFPLKTGTLDIGPMTLSLARARGDVKRESEPLRVLVTEPPLAGRPAGYAVGDVGRFELKTEVTPREVERGAAVGVTIDLQGTGNLPAQLAVPTRAGVEWLTPETREKLGATNGTDRFGGTRTFSYVVRMQAAGDVDLGEIQLPYWDPDARKYGTARGRLGTVHVTGTSAPAAADAPIDPLPGMPDVRAQLAGARPAVRRLNDSPLYWLGLFVAPLAYPAFAGARAAARTLRTRRAARAEDPRTEMDARVAEAEAKSRAGDAKALDLATARALDASASACVHVSLRGTTEGAAEDALAKAGLGADDARALAALYRTCQAARFSPEDIPVAEAKARWSQARALLKALGKAPKARAA